jgi:hypothetical protein
MAVRPVRFRDRGDEAPRVVREFLERACLAHANAAAALEQAEADHAGLGLTESTRDDVEILALEAAQGLAVNLETLLILVVLLHGVLL